MGNTHPRMVQKCQMIPRVSSASRVTQPRGVAFVFPPSLQSTVSIIMGTTSSAASLLLLTRLLGWHVFLVNECSHLAKHNSSVTIQEGNARKALTILE